MHLLRPHRSVVFFRKINVVNKQSLQFNQSVAQPCDPVGETVLDLEQSGTVHRWRPGVDQVERTLSLDQVDPSVQVGTTSEFAAFSNSCSRSAAGVQD